MSTVILYVLVSLSALFAPSMNDEVGAVEFDDCESSSPPAGCRTTGLRSEMELHDEDDDMPESVID